MQNPKEHEKNYHKPSLPSTNVIKDDDINFIFKIVDSFDMWCENEKEENIKEKVRKATKEKNHVNVILVMKLFPQNQEAA